MPDLTIDIYNARMEKRLFGSVTEDGVGWIPIKENKMATYIIDKNGNFSKYK
jgi:hypothetical protein